MGQLGIHDRLLELGIAELQDDGRRHDGRPGPEQNTLDASLGSGVDPPDVEGHERAGASNEAEHRAAFHGVDPDGRAIDGRSGRFQTRHADRDQDDDDQR